MRTLSRLILFGAFAPLAHTQSTLHTFDGDSTHDLFGVSVRGAGDVNGDGYPDLIAGAPGDDTWFRDENPGATSNFTDAVSVKFR